MAEDNLSTCLQAISGFKEHAPLASFSTFKIGGPADILIQPRHITELQQSITCITKNNANYTILGGGSNVLIADSGFRGVAIIPQFLTLTSSDETITCGASVPLQQCIQFSVKNGLSGLEHLAGIPGSVGGAVAGNAGTSAKWINSAVRNVTAVHMKSGEIKKFDAQECAFTYRNSIFKNSLDWCIVEIHFQLKKDGIAAIRQRIQDQVLKRNHQPTGSACAGCIFKNPPEASAGLLIEQCGLKGKRIGGAEISKEHANFIVNTGTATAEDVMILISYIKQQIRDKRGIQLQEEIRTIGF